MDMILYRVLCVVIGYGFGVFLSGFLYGKAMDVDLTKEGSGNVGTTNTMRILGVKAGVITLLADVLKCVLGAGLVYLVFRHNNDVETAGQLHLLMLYSCAGTILGHDFPVYMNFKGGKGIASTLGLTIVCFPTALPLGLLTFIVIVAITRYVSLGSIISITVLAAQVIIFGALGILPFYQGSEAVEASIIISLLAILAIGLHHANIGRLLRQEENKLSFKSARK